MIVPVESQLRLDADSISVRMIGPWLRAAIEQLDPDDSGGLFPRAELAVHEACMNVIDHAQLPHDSGIDLELTLTTERLIVRISDDGAPFDLDAVPYPRVSELQERGYGVKIIRAIVTDLAYSRVGSTNHLDLTIDIGSAHA